MNERRFRQAEHRHVGQQRSRPRVPKKDLAPLRARAFRPETDSLRKLDMLLAVERRRTGRWAIAQQ